jgi:hypothetical protein
VLNDRGWEAVSAVGELVHTGSLPCRTARSNPVSVTMPSGAGNQRTGVALDVRPMPPQRADVR